MSLFGNGGQSNNGIILIWQDPVATFSAIATTYPNPQIGWTTQATDTGKRYRWSGVSWDYIDYNALNNVVVSGSSPPSSSLWIDTNS